jgi:hypothetical protein
MRFRIGISLLLATFVFWPTIGWGDECASLPDDAPCSFPTFSENIGPSESDYNYVATPYATIEQACACGGNFSVNPKLCDLSRADAMCEVNNNVCFKPNPRGPRLCHMAGLPDVDQDGHIGSEFGCTEIGKRTQRNWRSYSTTDPNWTQDGFGGDYIGKTCDSLDCDDTDRTVGVYKVATRDLISAEIDFPDLSNRTPSEHFDPKRTTIDVVNGFRLKVTAKTCVYAGPELPLLIKFSIDGVTVEEGLSTSTFGQQFHIDVRAKNESYEWPVTVSRFFTSNIVPPESIGEKLISAVSAKKRITITIQVDHLAQGFLKEDLPKLKATTQLIYPVPFNNCAYVGGVGPQKMAWQRATPKGFVASPYRDFYSLVADSFSPTSLTGLDLFSISPFRENRTHFRVYASLKNGDDLTFEDIDNFGLAAFPDSECWGLEKIEGNIVSSLRSDGVRISSINNVLGAAYLGGDTLWILSVSKYVQIAVHEIGHAYASLVDAYFGRSNLNLYSNEFIARASKRAVASGLNCRPFEQAKSEWIVNGIEYGCLNEVGCGGGILPELFGETVSEMRRPSAASVMNAGDVMERRYDVPSCGAVLNAIRGDDSPARYFEECFNLDTLKPMSACSR